jgi:catechol 2,3-dioxygenase-like lactoylglutathione lyase family enzyme
MVMRMALTTGPHHVATLTADMDRLQRFYTQVFDAQVVWDLREEGLRHAFIDLGGSFMLHPFEIANVDVPQGELPLFGRGRIDHLALRAATAEVFWDVRERIYREGASDGQVTDLGPLLSAGFTDPDGLWGEVCWDRPPQEVRGAGEASSWRYIAYPDRA